MVEVGAFEEGVDEEVEEVPGVEDQLLAWGRPWQEMPGEEDSGEEKGEGEQEREQGGPGEERGSWKWRGGGRYRVRGGHFIGGMAERIRKGGGPIGFNLWWIPEGSLIHGGELNGESRFSSCCVSRRSLALLLPYHDGSCEKGIACMPAANTHDGKDLCARPEDLLGSRCN